MIKLLPTAATQTTIDNRVGGGGVVGGTMGTLCIATIARRKVTRRHIVTTLNAFFVMKNITTITVENTNPDQR